MGRKLIGFSPRAHGKERQSKLALARSSRIEAHSMCQKLFCGSSTSCMQSTSRPLIRPVASRDQWRWWLDLAVGSFCGKDGTNLGAEGSPRGLIRGTVNLAAPCSSSNIPYSTSSCRLTASTQSLAKRCIA
jgi:hypothetical protein